MKKRFLFFLIFLFAISVASSSQSNPVNKNINPHWKQIDSVLNLGLDQSAKQEIDKLFIGSKISQNHADFIKALFYKSQLNKKNPNPNQFIAELKQEIAQAKTPQLQILHSFLGDFYNDYYRSNRWKINQRTAMQAVATDDILNWTKNNFLDKAQKNYLASLEGIELLYSISIEQFKTVLFGNSEHKIYYPTLYNLLAQRAINYFSENSQEQPSHENNKNLNFLAPTVEFLNQEIEIQNAADYQLQTLKIYQTLSQLHKQHSDSVALAKTELNRLQFVFKNFHPSNQKEYLAALDELAFSNAQISVSAEINYEMARIYANDGMNYDPFSKPELQWKNKKAVEICNEVIQKYSESVGGKACQDLIRKIQNPNISLQLKEVVLPNESILASLSYSNIKQLYFRIIKLSYLNDENLSEQDELEKYLDLTPIRNWKKELPNEGDFQSHNLQIRILKVEAGNYVLLVSPDREFHKDSLIQMNKFGASEISFIKRDDAKGAMDLFILNRKTGNPMAGVKLDIRSNNYDYQRRKANWKNVKSLITPPNGYLRISDLPKNKSYQFILSKSGDTLVEKRIYSSGKIKEFEPKTETQFFTDRSIYRPGQTVFFKGIIYDKKDGIFKVIPNRSTEISLMDANRKQISTTNFTTNEFGSFNGSFIIPKGSLNGRMKIKNYSGSIQIQVEEYKRPNFEITFDILENQYRLNDSVKIKGMAIAFSGNPLIGAKGKYSITRTYSPIYFWKTIGGFYKNEQISSGEIVTNELGKFEILFKALADGKIMKEDHPVFNYKIKVEITDLNGETHESESNIRMAYTDLKLKTKVPEVIDQTGSDLISISASNLNDVEQEVNVSVAIFKLEEPDRIFKRRSWQRPDYFTTDAETFYTYFTYDQFDNENEVTQWNIDYQIFQAEINTVEVEGVHLTDFKDWPGGKYKITFTTQDAYDEELIIHKYFTLNSSNDSHMPFPQFDFFMLEKDKLNVEDTLRFIIGSSKKDVRVLYELQHKNKVIKNKWLNLNNNKQKIAFPIVSKHQSELTLFLLFIVDNEIYKHEETIEVTDPLQGLNIKLETFRPIIKPGSKEEWKIKISGSKNEVVSAELLCSMMDASLDKLKFHTWNFSLAEYFYNQIFWRSSYGFKIDKGRRFNRRYYSFNNSSILSEPMQFADGNRLKIRGFSSMKTAAVDVKDHEIYEVTMADGSSSLVLEDTRLSDALPKIRKNFNETAFFYPDLKTDKDGNISIKFTSPESLSRWKFMALAHTKNLRIAQLTQEVITQKELMVSPNIPRFFREGDTIYFNTKIVSLSDEKIKGETSLQFFDANTMKPIDDILLDNSVQDFILDANTSVSKEWKLFIPSGISAVVYRLTASSKKHSDGEERIIPVLTSKMLITESLPIHLNLREEKKVVFENLINSKQSQSLVHHSLKFEITSNPAWYAVLALPKIAEGKREDAISLFNRYYANAMANNLLNSQPEIKQVFDIWKIENSDALDSQLEKNQELKSVLLQETPWVLDAKNESERRRKLAQFFDENQINHELSTNLNNLLESQLPDGSWSWFKGMQGSRYISQHIVSGLVRLRAQKVLDQLSLVKLQRPLNKALKYLNQKFIDDYQKLKNNKDLVFTNDRLTNTQIQYLFTLSFIDDFKTEDEILKNALAYFFSQQQKYWMKRTSYLQGMIALSLFRNGDVETAKLILKSLKERSIQDEEFGVYWTNAKGFYWYQAPIETQALLIEAFSEIENDKAFIGELKKWLLKQKQTQMWSNPKASVEAVNALMAGSEDLLTSQIPVQVKVAKRNLDTSNAETGTGYFTKSWIGSEVNESLGNIELKNSNSQMAWGAMHWQYFEELDSITASEGILNIDKNLFVKQHTETGEVLIPINEREIKIGDKIVSRIIVKLDRDMEFIHIKDMRAPAFEPIQVLSGYRYQGGVGFYQSVSDLATHYYFDKLRSGTYIFENEMFVTQKGSFSNGISSIQCLYATEFNSHSKANRVEILE